MKKLIYSLLLVGILLVGCSESSSESEPIIDLTDSETKNLKLAQADLSLAEFNENLEAYNQHVAESNNDEYVNLFEGASYEAYLYTRAKLSKESYEKAQDKNIFDTSIAYTNYKSISESMPSKAEYHEVVGDGEEVYYSQHVANIIQDMTLEGNANY